MKHVEFYSKNKFEKLELVVGFIIRMYRGARSAEHQIRYIKYIGIKCQIFKISIKA